MKKLLSYKYSHLLIMPLYGILTFWYYALLQSSKPAVTVHCGLDDIIPFCAAFILPYTLWFFYLAAVPTFLAFVSKSDFFKLIMYIYVGVFIGLVFMTIYPTQFTIHDLPNPQGFFEKLVKTIYDADEPRNALPSIHCYNSICIAVAMWKAKPFKHKTALALFCTFFSALVCAATFFVKQHSVLDFFAACALALVLYPLVYCIKWPFLKKVD